MYSAVIVDDDKWALADIRQSFDFPRWGFDRVAAFQNADDAFGYILEHTPDLVVSDIRMGETSGLDLARKCRERNMKMVFILLSGYDSFSYVQDAFRYDVFFYMLKPIHDKQVTEIMSKVTEKLKENSASQGRYSDDSLGKALEYIDAHCCEHLTLEKLAAVMFMNPSYLSQLISKGMGLSFVTYRNKRRVERAKELIALGQRNVTILAEAVGFASPGQFFKVFKGEEKVSPHQYMNSLHSGEKCSAQDK